MSKLLTLVSNTPRLIVSWNIVAASALWSAYKIIIRDSLSACIRKMPIVPNKILLYGYEEKLGLIAE